jgi:hypothetical protein
MNSRLDQIINRDARIDWSGAVWAGLIAGGVFWLFSHGTPWFTSGMISPTMLGRDLKPPGLVDAYRSTATALIEFGVAVGYTVVLAMLVTRLRGIWAIGAGGLAGIGLYLVNFAVFRSMLEVNWTGTELPVLVTHVAFCMVAAGIYKGLAARRFLAQAPAESR